MFGSTGLRVALISSQGGPPVLEALGSTVVVVALVEVAVSSPVLPVLEPEVVGVPLDAVSLPLPSLSVALPLPLLPVGEAVGQRLGVLGLLDLLLRQQQAGFQPGQPGRHHKPVGGEFEPHRPRLLQVAEQTRIFRR